MIPRSLLVPRMTRSASMFACPRLISRITAPINSDELEKSRRLTYDGWLSHDPRTYILRYIYVGELVTSREKDVLYC